ncbi:nicotinate-nucleotide--dimethylbenzimidazole phosphoribosyltransferase [Streptomyces sp. NPDC051207]|uniref:nicotinate-nucleotide--dimethylbenzimidazole phosphoribosyltransferase n=1 Tax=Streptomyces sp. NPDC051207 TaxID=3154641 RepID=UPI00342E960B
MTDTGQIPGEGLPENAGTVEQPGVPAPGSYAYLSETTAQDEDLLLLPGAQSPWGNEVAPPAPEPVVEAVHQPGPHEAAGRDSGFVDLGGVRLPDTGQQAPPVSSASLPPRRPLHLGPPLPNTSASPVRSLADRGPADAPRPPGPEYLDAAPSHGAPAWQAQARPAETVVPPEPGAAEAAVTRAARGYEAQGDAPAQSSASTGVAYPEGESAELSGQARTEPGEVFAEAEPGQAVAGGQAEPVQTVPVEGGALVTESAPGEPVLPQNPEVAAPQGDPALEPGAPEGVQPFEAAVAEAVAVEDVPAPEPVVSEAAVAAEAAAPGQVPVTDVAAAEEAPVPDVATSEQNLVPEEPTAEQAPVLDVAASEQIAVPDVTAPEQIAVPDEAAAAPVPVSAAAASEEVVAPGAEAIGHAPAAEQPLASEADASEQAQAVETFAPVDASGQAQVVEAPAPVDAPGQAQAVETLAPVDVPQQAQAVVPPAPVDVPEQAQAAEALAPGATPAFDAAAPEAAAPPEPSVSEPAASLEPSASEPAASLEPSASEAAVSPEPSTLEAAMPPGPSTVEAAPALTAQDPDIAPPSGPGSPDAAAVAPTSAVPEAAEADPAQVTQFAQPAEGDTPAAGTDTLAAQGAEHQDPQSPQEVQVTEDPWINHDPRQPEPDAEPQPASVGLPAEAHQPGMAGRPAQAPHAVQPPQGPQSSLAGDLAYADAAQTGQQAPASPQPVGQFVPVDGTVPTTPHLAPTPPQATTIPTEVAPPADVTAEHLEPSAVPAARGAALPHAGPDLVQHADDLDTRAAVDDQEGREGREEGQEESAGAVTQTRKSSGPAAPGYDDAEREAVLKVMRERRDIRNGFRGDPIPHEVLLRVLEAAHTAPSVGHSQPWDFVVIRSAETRRAMHELAMRQRDAYAKSLPKGRAKQFKELKIEAILDTPVNIVVTADPTRGGRHTLGRHTQPQMAPYSSALAVENLWLAARAEGLGVGWVSFFDEREMVRALGLPEHLEVVAYLCVGYVDEFPDEPELMQAGWSKRRPLSWVVHEETYGRRALPGEEPHDLLAETVTQIRPLDAKALGEAWERQKRMTKPAGALGMLEIISAQLCGLSRKCPPPVPEPAAVAIFAGDHGVHAQGVTPWPQEVTAQMVANFLGGGAVCNAFANQVGAEVCVVDVGVVADLPATPGLLPRKIRAGTSDMTAGPAMSREEAKQAIEVGIETARDLVAAGNKALLTGEMGIANTTASAALIAVFTGADPAEVTGRGTGINDETLARKTEVVRRALEVHRPDPADPIGVLAAIGGFEHAAMVGLLLGGASLRTPVILDGVSAGAAALVARAIAPEVLAACIAGHRSAEPGHVAALNKLGLRPLVDLDLRLGEGTGALLALPLVQSTARAMHEVATFDSAGVTEK